MSWIVGLFGGMIVGGSIWGPGGAFALGLAGFVAGLVYGERRRKAQSLELDAEREQREHSNLSRLEARLESRLAAIEVRLGQLEGISPADASAAAPAAPTPATSAAQATVRAVAPPVVPRATSTPPRPKPAAQVPGRQRPSEPPPRIRYPEPPPREPAVPNPVLAWITGGNTIVRVGVVILFVGLAFLIKYAADRNILPDELKVAMVGAAGVALLGLGWRLRFKRRGYALSLQGAGVAVLYLTILVAMRLYQMVPPTAAFIMLALVAAFAAVIAVTQDALALAVIAAGGGFLAPILVSTGQGDHVTLFSYYLVLNVGLLLIAWHRSWRVLNVLGFTFTFMIGLAWGLRSYRPELFATTEPFLITFFLLYVAIAVLYARREAPALGNYVDGTIVFGTPLATFGLQAGLTTGMEFGLAYSSLAMAGLYVLLAITLNRVGRASYRLLTEAFLAMGVVFATLAIPLALDARWTSAAWAVEGAAIYWIGIRQRTQLARFFALLLQVGAGIAFVNAYPRLEAEYPIVGAAFIGGLLIAAGGLITNRLMRRVEGDGALAELERQVAPIAFAWGFGWLVFTGINETDGFVPSRYQAMADVGLFTLLASAFAWLHQRMDWREARWPMMGLLPILAVLAAASVLVQDHPLARYGWLAWPFAFTAHMVMLRALESDEPRLHIWFGALHVGAYLLLAALGAWELNWAAAEVTAHETSWSVAAVLLVPAALVLWAANARWDARWPLGVMQFGHQYRSVGAVLLLAFMGLWVVYANITHDGRSDPLPYLPLLNAIDLGHVLIGLTAVALWLCGRRTGMPPASVMEGVAMRVLAPALAFGWLNAILLRSIHHWAGVPYDIDDLLASVLVQTALSVFWAFLALGVMVFATRRGLRMPWMVGAALMGIVVIKLFVVDLSNIGGVERIVSFIGVGVLMLVIGYFSPVPPRHAGIGLNDGAEGIA